MGYSTDLDGSFKLDKPLDDETFNLLEGLACTRRMKRGGLPKKYGVEGEFFCEDTDDYGQGREPSKGKILDYNNPPSTQPSLWLQWVVTSDRQHIEWDGNEKFYNYVEWIQYIIEKILKPKGYSLTGEVYWYGEERDDLGLIQICHNDVKVKEGFICYR